MGKQGTYFIVIAMLMMVAPYILNFFGAYKLSMSTVFPLSAIFLGGVGVGIHIVLQIKNKTFTASGLMLLLIILTIIVGFSLMALNVPYAKYMLLAGTLLVAIWIIIPNNSKQKN
ncbi:MAG: hypothetical protein WC994_03015 [Brumimicrobium sp.]